MRFELMVGVTLRRFSKPMPSATRPPLRNRVYFGKLLVIRERGSLSQEVVYAKRYLITEEMTHRKGWESGVLSGTLGTDVPAEELFADVIDAFI